MIRGYRPSDFKWLVCSLRFMYMELFKDKAVEDIYPYISMVNRHIDNDKDEIFIDDKHRGFFIVRDETEAVAPTVRRYNGIRVFIHPEHRKGRVLLEFYNKLFSTYPDGDILGCTEINSEHIAVLDKRHELIAKVYKLTRSN